MLSDFYGYLMTRVPEEQRSLWSYDEFGTLRRVTFLNSTATVMETPNGRLSMVAMQVKEPKIYRHLAFMAHHLLDHYLKDHEEVQVDLFGQAYQAFVPLSHLKIEPMNAEGEILKNDRLRTLSVVTAVKARRES